MSDSGESAACKADARDDEFLSSVIACIEKNLSDADYSVEQLASDLCTSRGNLHRRLRDISGNTPSQLIKTARMKRACYLLENTSLPLYELAEKTGFRETAYFITVFKRTYGVTPGKWRLGIRSDEIKYDMPEGD